MNTNQARVQLVKNAIALTEGWTIDRFGAQVPPGSWPQCPTCGTHHHPGDHVDPWVNFADNASQTRWANA
jgi:hypothetical protein